MRRVTSILFSVILMLSMCMPVGNISVLAAENTGIDSTQEEVLSEDISANGAAASDSTDESAEQAESAEAAEVSEAAREEEARYESEKVEEQAADEADAAQDIETADQMEAAQVGQTCSESETAEDNTAVETESIMDTEDGNEAETAAEQESANEASNETEEPAESLQETIIEAPVEAEIVKPDKAAAATATDTWDIYPEGSLTVDGVREHIVDVKTAADISTTLNTELIAGEGTTVTYQWYVLTYEGGWYTSPSLRQERKSSLVLPGSLDYGTTERYMCKATDQYGNTHSAYFHLSAFVNSITSPNGHLEYIGYDQYTIDLPIHFIGKRSDGTLEFEPVTFEADVDADPGFRPIYSCSRMFVETDEYVKMSGKTATINHPGKFFYDIKDRDEYYNDKAAEIILNVYNPEPLNIYPEGAQVIDGERQHTVSKTVEPGESVPLTVISEETDMECYYLWSDPRGRELTGWGQDLSCTVTPASSGTYKCSVYCEDERELEIYFNISIDNDFHVLPTGYDTDPEKYDEDMNRFNIDLPESGTATLMTNVTASNVSGITYNWGSHDPKDTNLDTGWKTISGASGPSIQVSPEEDTLYRCRVRDSYGNQGDVFYLVTVPEKPVVYKDLADASVTLNSTAFTYTGSPIKPTITVKYDGVNLTEGADYTLSYTDNTNIGTAAVTVTGIGEYTGTITEHFTIKIVGWHKDGSEWYYYKEDGSKLINGWAKDSSGWCWMDAEGKITKNKWILSGGQWYYLKANGYMAANEWAKDSGGWYWMDASGKITKNKWIQSGGQWYYLKANGYMAANEWARDSGGWYWMDGSGKITRSQWIQTGGKWYYLGANGYMVTGTQRIGGKTYRFNSSGVWIQ